MPPSCFARIKVGWEWPARAVFVNVVTQRWPIAQVRRQPLRCSLKLGLDQHVAGLAIESVHNVVLRLSEHIEPFGLRPIGERLWHDLIFIPLTSHLVGRDVLDDVAVAKGVQHARAERGLDPHSLALDEVSRIVGLATAQRDVVHDHDGQIAFPGQPLELAQDPSGFGVRNPGSVYIGLEWIDNDQPNRWRPLLDVGDYIIQTVSISVDVELVQVRAGSLAPGLGKAVYGPLSIVEHHLPLRLGHDAEAGSKRGAVGEARGQMRSHHRLGALSRTRKNADVPQCDETGDRPSYRAILDCARRNEKCRRTGTRTGNHDFKTLASGRRNVSSRRKESYSVCSPAARANIINCSRSDSSAIRRSLLR